MFLFVEVSQAYEAAARSVVRALGEIDDEGFTQGSTCYGFLVETDHTPAFIKEALWENEIGWAHAEEAKDGDYE